MEKIGEKQKWRVKKNKNERLKDSLSFSYTHNFLIYVICKC